MHQHIHHSNTYTQSKNNATNGNWSWK